MLIAVASVMAGGVVKNKKSCSITALYLYQYAEDDSFCLCRE